jgi:ATP-binding cassette subfamily F protein 3
MLVAKIHEYNDDGDVDSSTGQHTEFIHETLDEVLMPFLDSVGCPDNLQRLAESKMRDYLLQTLTANDASRKSSSSSGASRMTRKLAQGVVSMSSDLGGDKRLDEISMMAATAGGSEASKVVAMHNTLIDAYATTEEALASAKDKRKTRKKELEKARRLLSSKDDVDIDALDEAVGGGLVKMKFDKLLSTGQGTKDKRKDIQVRNVTVSLDNGTVLLDSSELKFAHRRRYGLIGENGVGKSTLLKYIARGDSEMGKDFPSHIRVLHVRQEVPAHLSQDLTVMDAVIKSDIERNHLLEQEKELLAKLDAAGDASRDDSPEGSVKEMTVEEKRKKLLATKSSGGGDSDMTEMNSNLKQLDAVYARLQALGNDNVQSRAAMILSGLQFSPERQHQPVASLSGGWKMRVALAAALFIQPELLMLDEPTNHLVRLLDNHSEPFLFALVLLIFVLHLLLNRSSSSSFVYCPRSLFILIGSRGVTLVRKLLGRVCTHTCRC